MKYTIDYSGLNAQSADYSLLDPTRQMELPLAQDKAKEARAYSYFKSMVAGNLRLPATIGAPIWLLHRMEILRQMPPPTLQKMVAQSKASAAVRRKFDAKQTV